MTLLNLLKHYTTIEELPRFANRQGIAALLYNELVENGTNPFGKSDLIRLSGYAQKQAKKWEVQKESIGTLAAFCLMHGIKMFIFKGYGLSLLYDNPESRKSGDVDVLFFEENKKDIIASYEKINNLLKTKGVIVKYTVEKHSEFDIKGVHYENHSHFLESKIHKQFRIVEEYLSLQDMIKSNEWDNVYYPSPDFNAIYLPIHAGEHFVYEGASLKHIVDWYMFLKHDGEKVKWNEIYNLAYKTGIKKWIDVLNYIAVNSFDINSNCIGGPEYLKSNDELSNKVLNAYATIDNTPYNPSFLHKFFYKSHRLFINRWKLELAYGENFWTSYARHLIGYIKRERLRNKNKI